MDLKALIFYLETIAEKAEQILDEVAETKAFIDIFKNQPVQK